MAILIDITVALGTFLAAAYCMLLSRRLRALTRLDGDVGAAIAILSQQVDALTQALNAASQSSTKAESGLTLTIARAETATRNLELLLAAAQPRSRANHAGTYPGNDAECDEGADFAPLHRDKAKKTRVLRQRETIGPDQ